MFLSARSLLRVVGFERAGAAGRLLGGLQYRLDGGARRRMQAEMALALGRPADDPAVAPLLREAYRVNTAAVFEIMAMLDRRQDEAMLVARCELEGLEHLRAALAAGRGAILMARTWATPPWCASAGKRRLAGERALQGVAHDVGRLLPRRTGALRDPGHRRQRRLCAPTGRCSPR
jgi:hypothetical protein